MNDLISVTLIANAGLLIQGKNHRFLIDGIHHDKNQPFSVVGKEKLNQMINGSGQYQDVEYILYTHCHSDHFSEKYTKAYLEKNHVLTLFMPKTYLDGHGDFKKNLPSNKTQVVKLQGGLGELIPYESQDEIKIMAFKSLHLGEEYQGEDHYCFLLSIGDKNILITSDADYDALTFKSALEGIKIHTMVVNPLFYNHKAGREMIYNLIRPKEIIIYHIPFEEDDKYNLRRLTKRDMDKHHGQQGRVTALMEEDQIIHLMDEE